MKASKPRGERGEKRRMGGGQSSIARLRMETNRPRSSLVLARGWRASAADTRTLFETAGNEWPEEKGTF